MNGKNAKLSWSQRRFLAVLGLPAFGIALSYTLVTTYLPVIIHQLSGPMLTGVLIGGEGIFALFLAVIVGSWSDSLRRRLGGRMPFVLVGTVLAIVSLVFMHVSSGSLVGISIALAIFFGFAVASIFLLLSIPVLRRIATERSGSR